MHGEKIVFITDGVIWEFLNTVVLILVYSSNFQVTFLVMQTMILLSISTNVNILYNDIQDFCFECFSTKIFNLFVIEPLSISYLLLS